MKNLIKKILQPLFGIQTYLFLHAWFKIKTLKWDSKENDFFSFLALLPEEGLLLDIGANIGIMSAHLAMQKPNSTVYSFEPLAPNFVTLQKTVKHFKLNNITLFNFAIGDNLGEATMVLPKEKGVKMPGLSHIKHETITEFNEGEIYSVEVKTIDSLELNERITGIKLDVENFEYFALKGATATIKKDKPVIYTELWDNENRTKSLNLLKDFGYDIFVSTKAGLEKYEPTEHKQQNFIAIYSTP